MKQLRNSLVALCAGLAVAGCGYRPLYSTSNSNTSTAAKLASIEIPEQTDRRGQLIRNEILSSIGTHNQGPARYRLSFTARSNIEDTIQSFNSDILRKSYRLNVKFTLTETKTGKTVLTGTTFSYVSFDRTSAPFSDYQARINAQERAAREAGSDISTRVAAFFAAT